MPVWYWLDTEPYGGTKNWPPWCWGFTPFVYHYTIMYTWVYSSGGVGVPFVYHLKFGCWEVPACVGLHTVRVLGATVRISVMPTYSTGVGSYRPYISNAYIQYGCWEPPSVYQ